jgi:hypothetical protein
MMDITHRDTVGQDTTAQSTTNNGLIEAKLVSREYCLSHWVITLRQFDKCINVDPWDNERYSFEELSDVISSIGFHIKDDNPPVNELLKELWLPKELLERPEKPCCCVQWV